MYRKSLDGGFWVPMRGTTPPAPVGYTTTKPNHYYRIIECSKLKIETKINPSCGCRRVVWTCEGKETSRALCERCNYTWWKAEYPDALENLG